MIEYKRLSLTELPSLLRLYTQLVEDESSTDVECIEAVWEQSDRFGIVYFGALDGNKVVSTCF